MTICPSRLQLSNQKGFDLQKLSLETNGLPAVSVAASTKWRNPWTMKGTRAWLASVGVRETFSDAARRDNLVYNYRLWMVQGLPITQWRERKRLLSYLQELNGKNLACWCKPGECCHADVLLDLANYQDVLSPTGIAV